MANWQDANIDGLDVKVFIPDNYVAGQSGAMLALHTLDMGSDWNDLETWYNNWFTNPNSPVAQSGTMVVAPLLDQSGDPSGLTTNFGGVSSNFAPPNSGESATITAFQQLVSEYQANTAKLTVTGASLGGLGTEDMMARYNAYNGTDQKIFSAGLSMAGNDYGEDDQTAINQFIGGHVPLEVFHGADDTTVPVSRDQALLDAGLGGQIMQGYGHDVWDTLYSQTGQSSPLGWLMQQSTGGVQIQPPSAPQNQPAPETGNPYTVQAYLSQDQYADDGVPSNVTVSVDGNTVGTYDISAIHGQSSQEVDINVGAGQHDLSFRFNNDAWGGFPGGPDRNAYVNSVIVNGQPQQGDQGLAAGLYCPGDTTHFTIMAS